MRYAPDGNTLEPGVLRDVSNFASNNNGAYSRVPALVLATSTALTSGRCLGAGIVKNLAGTAKMYAGSATKPYQANGSGGWTDRSGGTSYSATVWDFCAFGNTTYAANGDTKLVSATTGNFASVTDSPTGCKIVFPHANALIALNSTADGAGWYRSKSGDGTVWTPTAAIDAASGTIYGSIGGPIIAGCAWENLAIAWKSRAMYAGTYVSSDPSQPIIRWSPIASDVGIVSQFAHVATEVGIVFVSERGIMLFNGNKPFNIDDDIRKAFMRDAMENRSKIFCTVDEGRNHVYVWVCPNGSTYCTAAYIWNYRKGTWGHTDELSDKTGVTHGDLRTPVRNTNYRDLVAIGGFTTNATETANLVFSDTGDYLCSLSGGTYTAAALPGDATITTGLLGFPGGDATIRRVIPAGDAFLALNQAVELTITRYDALLNSLGGTSPVTLSAYGQWDVMVTGRYFQLQITAGTTAAAPSYQSLTIEYSQGSDAVKRITI
jgi:hypothetical protein